MVEAEANPNSNQVVIFDAAGDPLFAIEATPLTPAEQVQTDALRARSTPITDLGAVGRGIAATCRQVMESLRKDLGALSPDELELTFGVTISAEGGIPLISKASGEATLQVRACWTKETPDDQQSGSS